MIIPFHRPDISFPSAKITNIIKTKMVVEGRYNRQLSEHFIKKYDVGYAIPCANCTSGLTIAIKALDLCKSDTILLPSFTWFSTLYAAECSSETILLGDINKDSWLLDVDNEYQDWMKLIISVDIFGSKSKVISDIPVLYDAAHSYGVEGLGNRGGVAEVVSFSYTKVVNGMQGGIILTNDKDMAEKCMDMVHKYAKLCEINALLVLESIRHFNNDTRLKIIDIYRKAIRIPHVEQYIPEATNYGTYSILFETQEMRDKVAKSLERNNVGYKIYYEPLSKELKNTNDVYSRILTLPVYKQLLNGAIKIVIQAINEVN